MNNYVKAIEIGIWHLTEIYEGNSCSISGNSYCIKADKERKTIDRWIKEGMTRNVKTYNSSFVNGDEISIKMGAGVVLIVVFDGGGDAKKAFHFPIKDGKYSLLISFNSISDSVSIINFKKHYTK